MQNIGKKKNLFGIFLVIIFISAVALPRLLLSNVNTGYWWDEAVYLGLAKNIAVGEGYQINGGDESFRPPLFPYMLSVFYPYENIIHVISPIFGIVGVIVLYFFVREIYGKKIAFVASVLLASSNLYFFFGQKILTETVSSTFFSLILLCTFLAFERGKKIFLIPVAASFGFFLLTKYTAVILFPIIAFYFLFQLLQKEKKNGFKRFVISKEFVISILIFLLILSPWFYSNYKNGGGIFWGMKEEINRVGPEFYSGPWHYYLSNWQEIFGVSALFAIPFVLFARKKDSLILISILVIFSFFSFGIERKEFRYLVSFMPVFYAAFAAGAFKLVEKFGANPRIIYATIGMIAIISLANGLTFTISDASGGSQMIEAAKYVNLNNNKNSCVIAENYPVVNYVSGRKIFAFPKTEEGFEELILRENISFVIVDDFEPSTPQYVKNLNYSPEKNFEDYRERVIVYRIK